MYVCEVRHPETNKLYASFTHSSDPEAPRRGAKRLKGQIKEREGITCKIIEYYQEK